MKNGENKRFENCERFREELEWVRPEGGARVERRDLLAKLPADVRGHAEACSGCLEAAEDVVETRNLLMGAAQESVEPGPWFASKVMNEIVAEENKIAQRDGVSQSVMKLAPRLVVMCALLLMLVGTWAFRVHQQANEALQMAAGGESLFEQLPAVLNDDVLLGAEGHR